MACKPTKPEIDRNWLSRHPICVWWVQWYFTDVETVDNSTGLSTGVEKLYIQWFDWVATTTAPTWTITDGYCPLPLTVKDPEIVCMTNDGGETVVKWVVIFNYDGAVRTSTINNLDGTVATGYTVIPCSTANQVIEWEARCDAGAVIVPFYDVETDWTASANIAFWFNPVANAVVVPSGTQTFWACQVALTTTIDGYQNLWNWTYTSVTPSKEVQIRYDTYKNWFVPSAGDVTVLVAWAMTGNKTYTIVPNTSRTIQLATNDIVSVTISWAVNNTLEVLFIN